MKTNKEIFDWVKSQDWGKEFEGLILRTYGMSLAGFIVSCDGRFGRFIHEGCNLVDEIWDERSKEFIKFYSSK